MTFYEVLEQVIGLLQRHGRVTYRALKRQYGCDDDFLADLQAEIIQARQVAVDQDGEMLVWTGGTPASPTAPPPPDAERRQLTVLFCDLVGSTPLSEQLDPEDLREVVRAYQATCAAVVERFDGHIAQWLGDALLVYFGWPQAHEDDAQRAVRVGLGILEAMGTLNARLAQDQGLRLAVRVGIHTGRVVVGDIGGGGRQEQLALGDTSNVASRIQGLATPDTVLISADTYRLVQGYFTVEALGPQSLKGVAAPMPVYRVLEESTARSRLEVAATRGLTPLVGRAQEVALLFERWAQVKDGMGQVMLLCGEAGIGKSRLVQVLQERVGSEGAVHIAFRCSPYHTHSALYPVITHLERLLQFGRDDASEAKLAKLERVLETYSLPLAEAVPLFAALLSLLPPEHYPPLAFSPQRQRQKTQEALVLWLVEETERQPVLAVWEDLHWADPSTLEWLSLVLDQVPTTRLFTLLTCRPEFRPPWGARTPMTQLTLNRLGRPQVEAMMTSITGGKALPAEVLEQVIARSDGVPLFVEEFTKTVLESGVLRQTDEHYALTRLLPALAIPVTLHDSLMARLDRLITAKGVAQLAAIIGRHFPYELLHAVSHLDDATLQRELGHLVEAELLYQRGLPPHATYTFKHALIQEAAYQSLLKRTRQQYHQRLAEVLLERFPDTAETQPEVVAHHFTEAGLMTQAIDYWHTAGQRATQRSAHVEAIAHLTRGLELLLTLPDTPERALRELTLQLALGAPLQATKGYAAPERRQVYTRAVELCQQLGETPQLFPALFGMCQYYVMAGELQTAREIEGQLLRLAQHQHDPGLLLEAHRVLAFTLFCLGEPAFAREHAEQGISLYDPQQHRVHAFLYGQDPGSSCRIYMALCLWHLGYPDQALRRSDELLRLAQDLSHAYSLAHALGLTAMTHQFRQERQATQEWAEAAITLSTEQGFPLWMALGTILRGWTLAAQGHGEEGLAQMHQGLEAWRGTGTEALRSYFLALLAEAYGELGLTEAGLTVLVEALAIVDRSGERFYEAELYRLKGELLQNAECGIRHATCTPEECFRQAIDIARRQQAKSLELRAAMSLSRLWQQQGRRTAARQVLAEVYAGFTEGFDTADLQAAKALLDALRA
jgi:TOMM system kinase/cyclase fusion protein